MYVRFSFAFDVLFFSSFFGQDTLDSQWVLDGNATAEDR